MSRAGSLRRDRCEFATVIPGERSGSDEVSLLSNEVELLRRVPLFAGIEPSKLKLLAFTSEVVTYHPGQVLFRKGDIGDAAYVIIKGGAQVTVTTEAGDIPVAELKDGDFL